MYLVPLETQNNSRCKLVEVWWVNNNGSADSVGVYNKMNNVYSPRRQKTAEHHHSPKLVADGLEQNLLGPPNQLLSLLLPPRVNPKPSSFFNK